jgi:hypothetical protein
MENLQLTRDELNLLTNLIGKELTEVNSDSWSSELLFDNFSISVEPDEIHLPTEKNLFGDIVTLRLRKRTSNNQNYIGESELIHYGFITDIIRLECYVEIENPHQVEAIELIPGFQIPAGQGWTNNILMPNADQNNFDKKKVLLGLHFKTTTKNNFTLYTDAVGYFVLIQIGQQLPDILKNKCEQISIKNVT